MKVVIDIPEEEYNIIKKTNAPITWVEHLIAKGVPLPKEHSFIAICDSDFPITEEVRQELKNTIFVGNVDCHYCFDMMEII